MLLLNKNRRNITVFKFEVFMAIYFIKEIHKICQSFKFNNSRLFGMF